MTDISSYSIKNPYININNALRQKDIKINQPIIIPKILHNIWLPGYDKLDEYTKILHLNIKQINPEWDFMIWDESSISGIIKKYPDMYALYMSCSSMTGAVLNTTCKAEIAKYVILKEYGGIYFDFEYQCSKPFDSLVSFSPESSSDLSSPVFVTYENRDWLEYIFSFGVEKYSSSWIAVSKNHPVWDEVFSNLKKSTNKYELFEAWNTTLKKTEYKGSGFGKTSFLSLSQSTNQSTNQSTTYKIKVIGDELNKGCNYVPNRMTTKTHTPCSSISSRYYNQDEGYFPYIWDYIKCHYKQLILLLVCILIIIGIHRLNDYNSKNFTQPSFPGMPGFGAPPPPQLQQQTSSQQHQKKLSTTKKGIKRGKK